MGKRRQATRAQEDRAGTANADRRQRWHAVANNTTELKPLLLATLTALVASFVLAGGLQRVQQELDVRGWLGRPALALTGARALLIVGTMGSGTTQRAAELRSLGLEVAHEASDSREVLCRDGTVSWAHGMRFLLAATSRRHSAPSSLMGCAAAHASPRGRRPCSLEVRTALA